MLDRLRRRFRRRPPRSSERVFFLHVPKCGGIAITAGLRGVCSPASELNEHAVAAAAKSAGGDPLDFRRDLLIYFLGCKKFRLVAGHYPYDMRAREMFGHDWKFVTVLRDPVERFFSHYFYNRYKKNDYLRINVDLAEFIDTDHAAALGWEYVRYFSGLRADRRNGPDADFASALANLKQFDMVGRLEHTDDLLTQFHQILGCKIELMRKNRNPANRETREQQITPEIRARAEEICRHDLKLFREFFPA